MKTQVRSLSVKAAFENEVDKYNYDEYEDKGIKIFIGKDFEIQSGAKIIQKFKLPFLAPVFDCLNIRLRS